MPAIAFETPQFRTDFRRASKQAQGKIEAFIRKFDEDARRGGLRLKTPETAADPSVKVARVDQDLRAVLVDVGAGDYVLHRVMEHDAAYRAASKLRVDVNALSGLPRLIEGPAPGSVPSAQPQDVPPADLFAHRRDRDFEHAGVPTWAIAVLRSAADAAAVTDFADGLGEQEPMLGFAIHGLLRQDQSIDELVAELLELEGAGGAADPDAVEPDGGPEVVLHDPHDIRAALQRPGAAERFRMVEDSDELIDALRGDFGDWQVFLHPLQRDAAYRSYSGPARVTGGAGTGKTVVLLHRAKALLDAAGEEPPRILLTTLTKHLKRDLECLLSRLVDQEQLEHIDITTVDELAQQLHRDMGGAPLEHIGADREQRMWADIVKRHDVGRSATFLRNEHRHVVLARGVETLEQYLTVQRTGRGVRLDAAARRALWPVFEAFEAHTRGAGRATTLQLTEHLARTFERLPSPLYDHVLVDEAQDLHASQWRLLRSIVPEGPDDLFLAGDVLQRIYGDSVSLRSLGIETRGRSVRLRRNYRTTHEIVEWALGLVGEEVVTDLDELGADLSGYHSVRHGPVPQFAGHEDRAIELARTAETVQGWLDLGYDADGIVVAARLEEDLPELVTALQRAGVAAGQLGRQGRLAEVVNVASFHRLKGLEFPCVALTGVTADRIPYAPAICPRDEDPSQHATDVLTERSLVYVAATRARDELTISWSGPPSALIAEELRRPARPPMEGPPS